MYKISFLVIVLSLNICLGDSSSEQYMNKSACEKQSYIWNKVKETEYSKLPAYEKFGLGEIIKMAVQRLKIKTQSNSDFAPKKWKKYLHARGSVAKIKFTPEVGSPYTGMFKGAECGIIRLSITFDPAPEKRNFAPGLALKLFRDGNPSGNVSALYDLNGQGKDYNYFKNSLSNIVPASKGIGPKLVHLVFKKVTSKPEQIKLADLGSVDTEGKRVENPTYPKQIFFVPKLVNSFASKAHDVREDFASIEPGAVLFDVYAVQGVDKNFNYFKNYNATKRAEFLKNSILIGKIETTSKFISSQFGDDRILFRHEVVKKKKIFKKN